MPLSDIPESEPQQGPSDWSREKASDDMLSEEARQRIGEVLGELAKIERGEP